MANQQCNQEIASYINNLKTTSEKIIFNEIPSKILELNQLLVNPEYSALGDWGVSVSYNYGDDSDVSETKIKEDIDKVISIVKLYANQTVNYVKQIELWVTMNVPKKQNGNNFGVEVQGEFLEALLDIEMHVRLVFEKIATFFLTRGKMISKAMKYPNVLDYRRAVIEHDENMLVNLRYLLLEVRDNYCALYDLAVKNIDKIRNPRNSEFELMY